MSEKEKLQSLIAASVDKARKGEFQISEIYHDGAEERGSNEFLFFIKPEVLDTEANVNIDKVLALILDKIAEYKLSIHNVNVLSASYLQANDIIAQHYGVINSIASNATKNISDGAKEKFREIYGGDISEFKVLGGLELIEQYPHFNAFSLDYLWQNLENKKLAGGTYVEEVKVDNEIIHVINGFHPRQLKHFTETGRCIIVMTLSGDLQWSVARNEFIGATNPANAQAGSLRRSFLENKEELGLAEVGQGTNGVHLSAGPVEALVELQRYNSDFSRAGGRKEFTEFAFGAKLKAIFGEEKLTAITSNSKVTVDGKVTSIFDLTEEKDSDEAIEILKRVL